MRTERSGRRPGQRGQSTVEFALVAIVLFGLLFAVIDLARAGLMQHDLDMGASSLARSLVAINNWNSDQSGSVDAYSPTPLDLSNPYAATAIPQALASASAAANGDLAATPPLSETNATTLSNGEVTVRATPSLSSPTEITVTVTAPFTPVLGLYLGVGTMHLTAATAQLTGAGVAGP